MLKNQLPSLDVSEGKVTQQITAPQNRDRKAEPENHNLPELKPISWNLCRNQCQEQVTLSYR